jgi:hypothetical protein
MEDEVEGEVEGEGEGEGEADFIAMAGLNVPNVSTISCAKQTD